METKPIRIRVARRIAVWSSAGLLLAASCGASDLRLAADIIGVASQVFRSADSGRGNDINFGEFQKFQGFLTRGDLANNRKALIVLKQPSRGFADCFIILHHEDSKTMQREVLVGRDFGGWRLSAHAINQRH